MNFPVFLAIGSALFFGSIAVLFSFWEEKRKRVVKEHERKAIYQNFELSVLQKLEDHLTPIVTINDVLELIVSSLPALLPQATIAYLLCNNTPAQCCMVVKEDVGNRYLSSIKEAMISSLSHLQINVSLPLKEHMSGTFINDTDVSVPQSLFNIPLLSGRETVIGVMTVSSIKEHAFSEDDMDVLYRITHHAISMADRITSTRDEESNKLQAMIKSLREGAFMIDPRNSLLVWNEKMRELLDIKKNIPTLLDIMNELPNGTEFVKKLERSMRERAVLTEHDLHIHGKILEMTITPVQSGESVIGTAVLLHDITAEKSVSQMKEDFTNIMVHELRSPLTAIKASSRLLISKDKEFDSEERKKLLQLINEQSQKLLDEVSMILDAAKLQAGLFTVQKETADLKKFITEAVSFFTPQAQSKYITLKADVAEDLPQFPFDTRYMALVLNNLISNSMKFTNVDGVITIAAQQDGDHIVLSIHDNGVGIPKEKQGALFTKFTQITTPSPHVGTGLGLYIVKGIVDAHKGTIILDSDTGRGTTITITLPAGLSESEKTLLPHPILTAAVVPNASNHINPLLHN